jgi:hypothetical protein
LVSFFSDQILNFIIFLGYDPFFSVDFFQQESNFSLMLFLETCCAFNMNIAVFFLNVFNLSFVHLFKFQNSLS